MSQAQNISKLATFLDSLESALENGDPQDVLAFLRVLRMNGLDGEPSAELVAAFSDSPQPADFERAAEWLAVQRTGLDLSDGSHDDDAEMDALLEEFDNFDPFESGDFISIADDLSEMDEIGDADAFLSMDEVDNDDFDMDLVLDVDVDEESGEGDDAFPPTQELHASQFFDADHTPDPMTTTGKLAGDSSSAVSLDDAVDSEASFTPAAASSTITGDRERTRQFDPAQLQALSNSSNAENESNEIINPFGRSESPTKRTPQSESQSSGIDLESPEDENPLRVSEPDSDFDFALGSSISTPLEDYGIKSTDDEDVHEHPTRREFQAPQQALNPPADTAEADDSESTEGPGTAEIKNPIQFDSGFGESPAENESSDDFDFDLAPESEQSKPDSGDDFDFDLAPEPEQNKPDSGDDFDFDLAPEPEQNKPDSGDDFDFDLAPEQDDSGDDFNFAPEPEQSKPDTGDTFDFDLASEKDDSDEFDFDLGPETDFTSSVDPDASTPATDDSGGPDMGYADPPEEGDSFFPPPIDDDAPFFPPPIADQEPASNQDTPTPSPFPESPSVAAEPTSVGDDAFGTQASSRPNSISPERPRQNTPMIEATDFESMRHDQKTPTHGSKPPPEGIDDQTPFPTTQSSESEYSLEEQTPVPSSENPLAEDELLALGEELSAPFSPEHSASIGAEESSDPLDRYRGEPMIRELGDEPTPSKAPPEEIPSGSFAGSGTGGSEETNPFAQEAPTGVRNEPMNAAQQSSFVLEEVDAPESDVSNPADAIATTLEQARNFYGTGKFETAMDLVDAVLEIDEDSEKALELKKLLEGELARLQASRLGSLMRVPSLSVSMGEVANLDIDHRAGFLLSQIDGMLTFEDILDMSAMSRLETLTLLVELFEEEIIGVD